MRHLLSVKDLTPDQIESIAERAIAGNYQRFEDREALLFFLEKSSRTRVSFSMAADRLGLTVHSFGKEELSLGKKESYVRTFRNFGGYCQGDVMVIRSEIEGLPRFVSEIADFEPDYAFRVVSGGDGQGQHPSQYLLDMAYVMSQFGRLHGLTIGLVGDLRTSRVAHSLLDGLRHFPNNRVRLVSVREASMPKIYCRGFDDIRTGDDLDLLRDCDIAYVFRVQEERYKGREEDLARVRGRYVINQEAMARLGDRIMVMHAQPVGAGEICDTLDYHPQVRMMAQSRIGVATRCVIMSDVLRSFETGEEAVRTTLGQEPEEQILVSESVESRLDKSRHKDRGYFKPVRNGTLLDHIPYRRASLVMEILRRRGNELEAVSVHSGAHSRRVTGGRKDVVILHDGFLKPRTRSVLKMFVPECMINEMREGTFRKIEPGAISVIPDGVGRCPNDLCITNWDRVAGARTRFVRLEDMPGWMCRYCERRFSVAEVTPPH